MSARDIVLSRAMVRSVEIVAMPENEAATRQPGVSRRITRGRAREFSGHCPRVHVALVDVARVRI